MLKHQINEQIFDVITPETTYWLGFLLTDGNVYTNAITGLQRKLDMAQQILGGD